MAVASGAAVVAPELILTPVGEVDGTATLDGATTGDAGIAVVLQGAGRRVVAFTDDAGHYQAPTAPVGAVTVTAVRIGYQAATGTVAAVAYAGTTTAPELDLVPGGVGTADPYPCRGAPPWSATPTARG